MKKNMDNTLGQILGSLALLVFSGSGHAVEEEELLDPKVAFAYSAEAGEPGQARFRWDIAEGYYLYRGRIKFTTDTPGITLNSPRLPPGKKKVDEFFGEVETYRHAVSGTVSYVADDPALTQFQLIASSQGCADLGVCYPPQKQSAMIAVTVPTAAPAPGPLSQNISNLFADDALPEEQAFQFEAIALTPDELLVRFTIADGYYLYRDKFLFTSGDSSVTLDPAQLPEGQSKRDEHFGDVVVYYDQVEIPITLQRSTGSATALELSGAFQGCKEDGICYPPMERLVKVDLPATEDRAAPSSEASASIPVEASAVQPLSEQDRLADALANGAALWTIISFFGFGLLLAFTPCVFPMVPILSGIIAGQSGSITTRSAFMLSLTYVLAMAVTYTAAGVVAGLFGQNLQAAFQNPWILGAFSGVFVLLSLSMFGFYELQLPSAMQSRLTQISNHQQGGTYFGAGIMGFLSALIVGPCVAPPLAAALIYIGQTEDPLLGGAALFALSMGMGTPLIIIGTSAGKLLPRAGSWMDAVKAAFGVMLLALAIWMLERVVSGTIIMALWGVLAIASGVYLGALEPLPANSSGWRKLWKSVGIVMLLAGTLEMIGAARGHDDWTQPLGGFTGVQANSGEQQMAFQAIKSSQDLDAALHQGRPVMLDFYADWCVECKRMERTTFSDPEVASALKGYDLLKADVTANDETDQQLMKRFGIIGPPATLFFSAAGEENRAARLVGYLSAEEFIAHLETRK